MPDSDDEFDDLFSFSTATITPKKGKDAPPVSSSSPIDFDLTGSDQDLTSDRGPLTASGTEDGNGPAATDASNSNSASASASASAHTSDTSSYYKVSPTTTDPTSGLDDKTGDSGGNSDDDDTFGEFDLGMSMDAKLQLQSSAKEGHQEDDFHAIDRDTRDFLDFLDEPSKSKTNTGAVGSDQVGVRVSSLSSDIADLGLSDDGESDDDGMMDFVDIDQGDDSPSPVKSETKDLDSSSSFAAAADTSELLSPAVRVVADVPSSPIKTHGDDAPAADKEIAKASPTRMSSNPKTETTQIATGKESTNANADQGKMDAPPQREKTLPRLSSIHINASQIQQHSILSAMDSTDSLNMDTEQENSGENEFHPTSSSKEVSTTTSTSTPSSPVSDNISEETNTTGTIASLIPEKKVIVFDTLTDAIHSTESSMKEIRPLLFPHPTDIAAVDHDQRPWLWSKVICSKMLPDVQSSSLADSFSNWDEGFDMGALVSGANCYGLLEDFITRLLSEVDLVVKRILASDSYKGTDDGTDAKRSLCSLLLYYYRSNSGVGRGEDDEGAASVSKAFSMDDSLVLAEDVEEDKPMVDAERSEESAEKDDTETAEESAEESAEETMEKDQQASESKPKGRFVEWNPLIAPVAATLLACGTTTEVASVMLSRIVPVFMPLISLTEVERMHAVRTSHQKLYYLICYHMPLLVLHLDRYVPGWYWPQTSASVDGDSTQSPTEMGRNLEAHGIIPITWFSSLLAGEGSVEALETNRLLALWDILLSSPDQSLKFFLALSVLERNSDNLLMLKGQELIDELTAVMNLERNDVEVESFTEGATSNKEELSEAQNYVRTWINHGQALMETTPFSVVQYLQSAEDEAVNHALNLRSKIAMEKMAARLEAENEAHRRTLEEVSARKVEARMERYYKERLEKFYKKHCPDKLDTIDKIMEVYKDRYEILDKKLQIKYGRGFLPLISVFTPKVASQTGQMLSNVNQGIEIKKKHIIAARAEERAKKLAANIGEGRDHQVAIRVSANEIMPIVCSGHSSKILSITKDPLKYYLVDSRPDDTLKVQGAFPTAARLSPEDLMDPERIQQKVEMFESLRGAIHICIMGEGFSSFPTLYGHPLDKNEQKLLDNDQSRTSKYEKL